METNKIEYRIVDGPDEDRVLRAANSHQDCRECRKLKFDVKSSVDDLPEYWEMHTDTATKLADDQWLIEGLVNMIVPYRWDGMPKKQKVSTYLSILNPSEVELIYTSSTKQGIIRSVITCQIDLTG